MKLLKITPCLLSDSEAAEAARFYCAIFGSSRIVHICRYGEAGHEIHGRRAGSVLTVVFELDGQPFTALNGGPVFRFNEAISLQVSCDTQEEVDYFWDKLGAGGDASAQQCGWLKDRYGLSWQVVPAALAEMMSDPDPLRSERVTTALPKMKKLDIAAPRQAFAG